MDKLVVIACSTGGPKALQKIIPSLPKDLGCPVLIIQHMPEGFTKSLANRLDELSEIKVIEAEEGLEVENNIVYLAKGGFQMKLQVKPNGRYVLALSDIPAKNGLRPCADVLLKSLIQTNFKKIICAVLTGMGDDGLDGIRKLRMNKQLYIVTQDKETSTVYGMPKAISLAGYSDEEVPLSKVTDVIMKNLEVH